MENLHDNVSDLMSELKEVEYDIHMTKRSEILLRSSLRLDLFSLLVTNVDLFEEHHISILTKYVEYAHKWIEDENDRLVADRAIADESVDRASADQQTGGQASPVEELNHYVSNYVELAKQFLVSFDELVRRKEYADRFAEQSSDRFAEQSSDKFAEQSSDKFADCPHVRTSDDWIDVDPERSVRIIICDDCGVTVDPNIARIETNGAEQNLVVREHLEIRCNCPSFRRKTKIGCNACPPNPRWEQHLLTNCPLCISSEPGGTSATNGEK